ncbi:purine-nucleoside phosphorylase [Sporobolomyces koalae]|uniref:purine-nucleoside phosphorylase n=1 Tax=Sporobolomyces koalae TaxID=500713 RepID=UPI00317B63A4
MLFKSLIAAAVASSACAAPTLPAVGLVERSNAKVSPKVMIVSMFTPEREVWLQPLGLSNNVSFAGASPLFPHVACNDQYSTCIVTTGEAEINAASTIMALTLAPQFNLTETYFLIAGIGGIRPTEGTLGSAAWARFSVQSGLAYELDARQIPSNWSTGYWALGTKAPGQLPATTDLYGTEVFELNTNLLNRALNLTKDLTLNDSSVAQEFRKHFDYAPANQPPRVFQGDALCSDAYFAGTLLSDTWANYTKLMTKGQGTYALTAQEDNASLEAFMRASTSGLVDYSRILLLRTASDFDSAPNSTYDALEAFQAEQGGFEPAIQNILIVGWPVVKDIEKNWTSVYQKGIAPPSPSLNGSYYGDDLGTLRNGTAQARRARRSYIRA